MPLLNLPNEVLLIIAKNLQSPRDINCLLQSDRLFAQLLTPLLYKFALQDVGGMTPLQWAAWRGHESLVRFLLKLGIKNVDFCNPAAYPIQRTALYRAVQSRSEGVVRILLESGADINFRDSEGQTVLHDAVRHDSDVILRLLLALGADPSIPNRGGGTALHIAVAAENEAAVRALLENGVDVNTQALGSGKTALHFAVYRHSHKFMKVLLGAGADTTIKNQEGRTALDCAYLFGIFHGSSWDFDLERFQEALEDSWTI